MLTATCPSGHQHGRVHDILLMPLACSVPEIVLTISHPIFSGNTRQNNWACVRDNRCTGGAPNDAPSEGRARAETADRRLHAVPQFHPAPQSQAMSAQHLAGPLCTHLTSVSAFCHTGASCPMSNSARQSAVPGYVAVLSV